MFLGKKITQKRIKLGVFGGIFLLKIPFFHFWE